jgi:lauroyl/myristoyl acyltransferase
MYHLAKFLRNLLLRLPLWVCLLFGRLLGLLFYLNPRKKRLAFKNIKIAFPEKNSKELFSILRRSFSGFGLSFVESLISPRIYKYLTLKEEEKAYKDGGMLVGIHAGSWEMAISYCAQKNNLAILAEEQKHKSLDKFLNQVRREGKIDICFSIKQLIKRLGQDYLIGLVIDHGPEADALDVDFFSHPVPTPKGGVYLAKKFNKKIYTTFCYRVRNFSHVLEIGKPIDPNEYEIEDLLKMLNKIYEGYLTKYPWEYFWCYKRFKYKKDRQVVVLSDGKSGHLKQSKAFLAFLAEEAYMLESKVIEIKYRTKSCRLIADILAFFCGRHWLGSGKLLSVLVDRKSWEALDKTYADIVVSTGSFISPLNKLFSSYLGAKSVAILRSNIPLKRFDLVVLPEHDRTYAANAIIIKGALSYPQDLGKKTQECQNFFNLSQTKKITVFLGGPLGESQEFMDNLKCFIGKLKNFASSNGYKILFSTSRRTPPEAEAYLEKELSDFPGTEALVIVNQNNYDFVFESFSVLGSIIFVSSESISMISEVASLQKPCICTSFEEESNKHKLFLESMEGEIAFLNNPYEIEQIDLRPSRILNKNKVVLKKAIQELL